MKRTNIYLDEELDRWLRHLAVEQQRSFTDLVREALHEYLERRGLTPNDAPRVVPPRRSVPSDEWRAEMTRLLQEVRASVETDMTPDEIEDAITAACQEARDERIARQLTARD